MSDPLGILKEENGKEIELTVEKAVVAAEAYEIQTDEAYQKAGEFLKEIKTVMKKVDDYFDPAIKQAYQAHKAVKAAKDKQYDPLVKAENLIKIKMGAYHRKRKEEAERAEAERLKALAGGEDVGETLSESVTPFPKPLPKVKGVKHTAKFEWKLVDLAQMNDKFKMPDIKAINAIVKTSGKRAQEIVGGIQVWESTTTSVTT